MNPTWATFLLRIEDHPACNMAIILTNSQCHQSHLTHATRRYPARSQQPQLLQTSPYPLQHVQPGRADLPRMHILAHQIAQVLYTVSQKPQHKSPTNRATISGQLNCVLFVPSPSSNLHPLVYCGCPLGIRSHRLVKQPMPCSNLVPANRDPLHHEPGP